MAPRSTRSSRPKRTKETSKVSASEAKRPPAGQSKQGQSKQVKAKSTKAAHGTDDGVIASTLPGLNSRQLAAIASVREIFWHDVLREMLMSLAMRCAQHERGGGTNTGPIVAPGLPEADGMFDGRLGVIINQGQRIPIASIMPVFSMGVGRTPAERALSMAVECTIFQIRTPAGEVFTLPIHEIRAFHSMSEELIQSLERTAREALSEPDDSRDEAAGPFGFAAFTSLSRRAADVPLFAPPGSQPDTGYLPG